MKYLTIESLREFRRLARLTALVLSVWFSGPVQAQNLISQPQVQPAPQPKDASAASTRVLFRLDHAPSQPYLVLTSAVDLGELKVNGQPVKLPLEGMRYKTIYHIPASLLKAGDNTLESRDLSGKLQADAGLTLREETEADLAFQTGPIIAAAGTDFLTITCRTTLPAAVMLKLTEPASDEPKSYSSPAGYMHSIKIEGLKPGSAYQYSLTAAVPESKQSISTDTYSVKTIPTGNTLFFAATGDSRSNPKLWGQNADAIAAAKPAFVVHTGDLVVNGVMDALWDEQFFTPAKQLCATVPFYPVLGNHERQCPLFDRLFATPAKAHNWQQQIGPVLLVGIDREQTTWTVDGPEAKWLEDVLKSSQARFIFVMSHYPAWSSGRHGNDKVTLDVIFPLLEKYNVTAMIAGHDHIYERSEPGKGTTMLVAGGGGAPLYDAAHAKDNPHSKVFKSVNNYLLFAVEGDTCTMRALDLQGQQIDTCSWTARKVQ